MAEGKDQSFGSIFGPFDKRVMAREGVGLKLPGRDPDHENPNWYQLDLDQEDDDPFVDPLPTERHRRVT